MKTSLLTILSSILSLDPDFGSIIIVASLLSISYVIYKVTSKALIPNKTSPKSVTRLSVSIKI